MGNLRWKVISIPCPLRAVNFKLPICLVNGRVGDKASSRCSHNLGLWNILDSVQLFQSIVNWAIWYMNWFWKRWSNKCSTLEIFSSFIDWLLSSTMCGIIHVKMEVVAVDQFTSSPIFELHCVNTVLALETYINIPLVGKRARVN